MTFLILLLNFALDPDVPAPTSNSTTQSLSVEATDQSRLVRAAFAQLADSDPATRDTASEQLMGLHVEDLPLLIDVIKATKVIAPSQEIALHEIVAQICLTGMPYNIEPPGVGFLGVQLSRVGLPDSDSAGGAMVYGRIPGFSAYRFLRDGDRIVGIREGKHVIHNHDELMTLIMTMAPGKTVHLQVERGGRERTVPIVLAARPVQLPTITDVRQGQKADVEAIWDKEFAPLFPHAALPGTNPVASD